MFKTKTILTDSYIVTVGLFLASFCSIFTVQMKKHTNNDDLHRVKYTPISYYRIPNKFINTHIDAL